MRLCFTQRRIIFILVLLCWGLQSGIAQPTSYQKGVIHVKLKQGSTDFKPSTFKRSRQNVVVTGLPDLDQANQISGATEIKRIFNHGGKYEKAHQAFGLDRWYEIKYDSSVPYSTVYKEYSESGYFMKVERPSTIRQIQGDKGNPSSLNNNVLTSPTTDPLFQNQWHYQNSGQTGGVAGADIALPSAWSIETGNPTVIVAVIDGGIDILHPDLQGALWRNTGEVAGNNIDDDNNGYVDDINGYGFGDNTGQIFPNFHGTHVAGTIGAITNNSIGVAGIAGGSGTADGVRLMSCAGFGNFGIGGFENAMVYAADNGAVISQNSWGGGSSAIEDAIDYFIARAGYDNSDANFGNNIQIGPMAGGIVIFAAGNSNTDNPAVGYPASYPPVMAVASTDHNDTRSGFSNYGSWVDIAAPGSNVYSTYPVSLGSYEYLSGTSMACPHVSGVAALIISKKGAAGFMAAQAWDFLVLSTDNIDSQNPSFVGLLGSGRLNALNALATNDGIAPAAIQDLRVDRLKLNSITVTWTASGGSGTDGVASYYDLRFSLSPITAGNFSSATKVVNMPRPQVAGSTELFEVTGLAANSRYYFAIKAADFFGNISGISNIITGLTPLPPIIQVSPSSLSESLLTGASRTREITISNTGASELEFDVKVVSNSPSSIKTSSKEFKPLALKEDPYRKANQHPTISTSAVSQSVSNQIPHPLGSGKLFITNNSNEILQYDQTTGTVIHRIPTPESVSRGPDGLAYDGTYLYYVNGFGTRNFYQLDPDDGAVVKQVTISSITSVDALAHNGEYLYALDYNRSVIYEIDFNAGTIVNTITPGISLGGGMSFGGSRGSIFVGNFSSTIYELSIADGSLINQFSTTGTLYGIGYSESTGLVYGLNVMLGLIESYNPETGARVSSFASPGGASMAADEAGSQWIKPNVTVTSVLPGQSVRVPIAFNAQGLDAGLYQKNLVVKSNDPVRPEVTIPASLTVIGAPNLLLPVTSIDFENQYLNTTKTLDVVVINNGTDLLSIDEISFDKTVFSSSSALPDLAPGQRTSISVKFTPTTVGLVSGTVTISSNDPDAPTATVNLSGVGVLAPSVAITPSNINSTLFTGGSENKELTITNSGGSLATFTTVSRFISTSGIKPSNVTKTIDILSNSKSNNSGEIISYGSTTLPQAIGDFTSKAGSPFPLTCLAIDGDNNIYAQEYNGNRFVKYNPTTNIWSTLANSPVSSGNNGGATYQNGKIYVSYVDNQQLGVFTIATNSWVVITKPVSTGNITSDGTYLYLIAENQFKRFDPLTNIWSDLPPPPFPFQRWGAIVFHNGIIYGHEGNGYQRFGKYSIADQEWTQLANLPGGGVLGAAIDPVNETYYTYGSYFGNNLYSYDIKTSLWSSALIPLFSVNDGGLAHVSDPANRGVFLLEGERGTGFARFETGGSNWFSHSPTNGTVAIRSSRTSTLTLNAAGLQSGVYTGEVVFTTNDPINSVIPIPIKLTVIGAPDITPSISALDFDSLFTSSSKQLSFTIKNTGTENLNVTNIQSSSGVFSVNFTPFTVTPGSSKLLTVDCSSSSQGTFEASLTVSSNDPDENTLVIPLRAKVTAPPVISVFPNPFTTLLTINTRKDAAIRISNIGGSKLVWSLAITNASGTVNSLDNVLENLNSGHPVVTQKIPDRFEFAEGESGNYISDGGNDMYDGGNVLTTPFDSGIPYSDKLITSGGAFGPQTKYFTAKYPGLFLLAADISVNSFTINGNLGADGGGLVDGHVLSKEINGITYKGFVKRVHAAGDPSVNHLVIVADNGIVSHDFNSNSNDDYHQINGLSGVKRLYYLLFSSKFGGYVNNQSMEEIMSTFLQLLDADVPWLEVSPKSGNTLSGISSETTLTLKPSGMPVGIYQANLVINSNDISNPVTKIPVTMNLVTTTNTPPTVVSNIGNQSLRVKRELTINLPPHFSDADNHTLLYSATSTASIASATVLGSILTVTAKSGGKALVTVYARDIFNDEVSTTFELEAIPNYAPSTIRTIPDIDISIVEGLPKDTTLHLGDFFADQNQDILSYSVTELTPSIATQLLSGANLKFTAKQSGSAKVKVTATDPEGLSSSQSFELTVSTVTGVENENLSLSVYPNPIREKAIIRYTLKAQSSVQIHLCDLLGRVLKTIEEDEKSSGQYDVEFNTDNTASGYYMIRAVIDSRTQFVRTLIVK